MTKYYCDLCGEEIKDRDNCNLYELPIATENENRIRNLDELLLCKKCERSLYNAIANIALKDCLTRLRYLATDICEDEDW